MAGAKRGIPRVVADGPLADPIIKLLQGKVEWIPWETACDADDDSIDAVYTYGHPVVDGARLDRWPKVRVISNYGVGVDHINLADAAARRIPVGNTPGILDGATADMAFALLLAAARRLVEGDRYARSPQFTRYDPDCLLGREVHGSTLGILGMGRIGGQIARRARAFDMAVLYHNRRKRNDSKCPDAARYVSLDELLTQSDYVVVTVPLTDQTRGMIGPAELSKMKSTATLINVARGPVVDTDALTAVLERRQIHAAAIDVTDPEPLPRDHPLLHMHNLVVTPHLGSATEQTRQRMAEVSVTNLLNGLAGRPLEWEVRA